ncbi:MAG TPA: nucleotidyl transferase AbiEii/AbiGii toxin family protein [Thermodesulfobacteriota bacterium]
MRSVAPERPIPPIALEVLRHVDRATREFAADYLVAGAMARDILLYGVFGLDPGRATLDLDLAVAVETWPQFDAIKVRLVETGAFAETRRAPHRLVYRAAPDQRDYTLDLLPFGGVEAPPGTIAWPPEFSIVMSVTAYREALAEAEAVEVAPGFVVRVTSLPGLAVLKLLAWRDRGAQDPRDAVDLATLLRLYASAGNEDRLLTTELDLLEAANYDLDLAGPRLLGKDSSRIVTAATRRIVVSLLDDAAHRYRLVSGMARACRGAEDPVAAAEALIDQFAAGFRAGL